METGVSRSDGLIKLRILATTDLHAHLYPYDYYRDAPDPGVGFAKVATLIHAARAEQPNVLLFDNGDLIQGNPLAHYIAHERGLGRDETHPVIAALNLLDYDAAAVGNHDLDYGLDFIAQLAATARFPMICANLRRLDGAPIFPPVALLARQFLDADGVRQRFVVGVFGLIPPQVMLWNRDRLGPDIVADDLIETARRCAPALRAAGADLVIALAHSGVAPPPGGSVQPTENVAASLAEIADIDVIIAGHTHRSFPDSSFADLPAVDLAAGTVHGVPIVMAGFWGSHLGVIDLDLRRTIAGWCVAAAHSAAQPIDRPGDAVIDADAAVLELAAPAHRATIAFVGKPVAQLSRRMTTYFALVEDNPVVRMINRAQLWAGRRGLAGALDEGASLLSAAAPVKAGGWAGASRYVDIPAGELTIRHVIDCYPFPNTLRSVALTGREVAEWLEMSATVFNQIAPDDRGRQALIDDDVPAFEFDVLDGVTYQIDVAQAPRYSRDGRLINPAARRIVDLRYRGVLVAPEQPFVVMTSNYRANGGGNFPFSRPAGDARNCADVSIQQVIIDYLQSERRIRPDMEPGWSFKPVDRRPVVTFESACAAVAEAAGHSAIRHLGAAHDGFALFALDLPLTECDRRVGRDASAASAAAAV